MYFHTKDFCLIFQFTPNTFRNRIKPIAPLLRGFKENKRKRLFTIDEIPVILKYMPLNSEHINLDFSTPQTTYLSKIIAHLEQIPIQK